MDRPGARVDIALRPPAAKMVKTRALGDLKYGLVNP